MKAGKVALLVICGAIGFLGFELYRAMNATAFNTRLAQQVQDHALIGAPENNVVAVLGRPNHRVAYPDGDFTLNYHPSALLPFNKFQAHFRSDGTLRSVELMDD